MPVGSVCNLWWFIVKEYNWIFTGKNSDIIDLELDYNLTYFKIFEKSSTQKGAVNTGANVEAPSDEVSPSTNPTYQPIAVSSQTAGTNTNKGFKPNTIEEYFDQQLNSPDNADLVTLDVTIIGDPDWIPQDRSVRPKGLDINAINSGFTDDDFTKGIATDVDSVYVKFSFRTPRDYNDTTGLMELTQDQTLISGVYKVTTVESNFSGGRFTQTLNLIRAPQQKENDPKTAKVVSPERVATSAFPDRPTFVGNNTSGAPVSTPDLPNPSGQYDAMGNFTGGIDNSQLADDVDLSDNEARDRFRNLSGEDQRDYLDNQRR